MYTNPTSRDNSPAPAIGHSAPVRYKTPIQKKFYNTSHAIEHMLDTDVQSSVKQKANDLRIANFGMTQGRSKANSSFSHHSSKITSPVNNPYANSKVARNAYGGVTVDNMGATSPGQMHKMLTTGVFSRTRESRAANL